MIVWLDGLATDERFAGKLVQLDDMYRNGDGRYLVRAIVRDEALRDATLDVAENPGERLFTVRDEIDRRLTFRTLLVEASVQVTSAMVVGTRASTCR